MRNGNIQAQVLYIRYEAAYYCFRVDSDDLKMCILKPRVTAKNLYNKMYKQYTNRGDEMEY